MSLGGSSLLTTLPPVGTTVLMYWADSALRESEKQVKQDIIEFLAQENKSLALSEAVEYYKRTLSDYNVKKIQEIAESHIENTDSDESFESVYDKVVAITIYKKL